MGDTDLVIDASKGIEFEIWLLCHHMKGAVDRADQDKSFFAQATVELLKGEFSKFLSRKEIEETLESVLKSKDSKSPEDLGYHEQLLRLLSGIGCLFVFLQWNWTGPQPKEDITKYTDKWKDLFPSDVLKELSIDGEIVYSKTDGLHYLFLAREIFMKQVNALNLLKSTSWWTFRFVNLYEQVLANRTQTLYDLELSSLDSAKSVLDVANITNENLVDLIKNELSPRYYLEGGLMWTRNHGADKAKEDFIKATEASGLTVNLTGALGVRTKFQQTQTSQLILEARSKSHNNNNNNVDVNDNKDSAVVPAELSQEDDIYHAKPLLANPVQNTNLNVIDQAIILALSLDIKSSNPQHEITSEEMRPYIQRVLEHPNNWMVHSMGLLLKARIEYSKGRTMERAALQVQVLVDQYTEQDSSTLIQKQQESGEKEKIGEKAATEIASPNSPYYGGVVGERLRYLFALAFPPRWELKRELGQKFLSLGVAMTALELFQELEMWEEVVECYRIMKKNKKAEEIVRGRLENSPNDPLLWCVLGDLTNDDACYKKAWELSGRHMARAQRSLARSCVKRSDWVGVITHYEIALAINPLFAGCWFTLGCAYMHLKEWEKSISSFQRCVRITPDEGEAWNNMASVYVSMKKKKEAFYALQEALKAMRQNWRIWQNYLYICIDINEYQQAITAIEEILDLQLSALDIEILTILCKVVTRDIPDSHGIPGIRHKKQLDDLLEKISLKISNNPKLWKVYAQYYADLGEKKKALEFYEKRHRSAQKAGWEIEKELFEDLAEAVLDLAEAYLEEGSDDSLYSGKTMLRSLLKRAEDSYGSTELYKKLQDVFERINAKSK